MGISLGNGFALSGIVDLDANGEYLAKTKVGRWTDDKLRDLDNF
jgi:hypothetical protein